MSLLIAKLSLTLGKIFWLEGGYYRMILVRLTVNVAEQSIAGLDYFHSHILYTTSPASQLYLANLFGSLSLYTHATPAATALSVPSTNVVLLTTDSSLTLPTLVSCLPLPNTT